MRAKLAPSVTTFIQYNLQIFVSNHTKIRENHFLSRNFGSQNVHEVLICSPYLSRKVYACKICT